MRSRKLQALDFIRRYIAKWGQSPSLSEVAGELGVSRQRAHELVGQLSRDRQVQVVAGRSRGIVLVDHGQPISEAQALVMLSRLGWRIADDSRTLTENGLLDLPELDHKPE